MFIFHFRFLLPHFFKLGPDKLGSALFSSLDTRNCSAARYPQTLDVAICVQGHQLGSPDLRFSSILSHEGALVVPFEPSSRDTATWEWQGHGGH